MNLVVLDLEWNQAMSSKSEVFNHLPIHLRGEIIEIGAVKLNPDLSLGDEFTADVRPVYFRRMHYKVKKITGFDKDRLAHGLSFPEAMEKLRLWCGDDVTFLTWGWDDQGIFEQNIIIHDLDWDWISGWVNLLVIGAGFTGILYAVYFSAVARLPGQQAAVLSYIDPAVSVLVSVFWLHEPITALQVLGGLLILVFAMANELGRRPQ